MKNLHLIPTDKPSRLHFDDNLFLSPNYQDSKTINSIVEGRNIYITTSNEEIKEGDWFLNTFNDHQEKIQKRKGNWRTCFNQHKIILTDNKDLIKDGVQSIDDEFLEWFCSKNPSCEEVEVKLVEFEVDMGLGESCIEYGSYYKIILPKEETKNTIMENKTLTAVEWLMEEIVLKMGIRIENTQVGKELVEKALALQKEQTIDACKEFDLCENEQDWELYYTTKYGKQ